MNILDTIVENKRVEILKRRRERPVSNLKTFAGYGGKTNAIDVRGLGERPGIIAEFKRRSPSRGSINAYADPVTVAGGYREAGAVAMSILTDRSFFGGSFRDLLDVRLAYPDLVLLRKDFIIDSYQIHESSAYGADMVLLIAAILERRQVEDLALEAQALGLQVLFEVHDREDLDKYHPSISFVGVNNRDLKTFRVDTGRSTELIRHLPAGVIPVSESGIGSTGDMKTLRKAGFRLFLVGERLMAQKDPGAACRELIGQMMNEWKDH